jgi:hypothetical protein
MQPFLILNEIRYIFGFHLERGGIPLSEYLRLVQPEVRDRKVLAY